ncbi:MAG TPA: tyrosine-type recombinase/integrase, partial [Steroidobacteraceae bacterium]
SCAGGKTPAGADATHSVLKPSTGACALARTAFASAGHGDIHIGHGTSGSKRHGTDLGASRPVTQARLDSSGPSKGQEGFTYHGQPIKQVSTAAWYKALKRAGFEDFRWHDLRHTWASWHVQGGTPLFALQELAGWETEKMVRRYAHLAAEHLAVYAGNTESHGTNTAQPPDFHGTARLQLVGK